MIVFLLISFCIFISFKKERKKSEDPDSIINRMARFRETVEKHGGEVQYDSNDMRSMSGRPKFKRLEDQRSFEKEYYGYVIADQFNEIFERQKQEDRDLARRIRSGQIKASAKSVRRAREFSRVLREYEDD